MNKELIKTYFKEFNHWLDGGNVQAFYIKDDEPKGITDEECIEYEGHDNFSHIMQNSLEPEDVLIIIDDEYVRFRSALIEGKTVEYLTFRNTWENLKENCILIDAVPARDLRIKPDEPKFKIGDWVIHNGVVKRVTKAVDGYIDSLDNEVAVIMKEESLELWEPEDEKYFWYKNDLVRFHETQANLGLLLESARGCSYYPAEKNFEDYCEPFIGKLPSNLKQDSEIYKSNNKKETNERN